MTIDLDSCTMLMDAHMESHRKSRDEAIEEIEVLKIKIANLEEYVMKENYHIDKFSKVMMTVQMDRENDKPFDEIHPHLFKEKKDKT